MEFTLNDGHKIPVIGFGTWQTPEGTVAKDSVQHAIEAGYTHIDTAAVYGNEVSVGEGIKASGIARSDLYLTTKLWNDKQTYQEARDAIVESMEKLGVDYLDLYLIHWPNPKSCRESNAWKTRNAEVWRAMEDAQEAGLIRSIGVSNFHSHHLDALLETARVKPAVNQIYLSPSDQQAALVDYNNRHDIVTEAYSPLGTGTIVDDAQLKAIGEKYGKSAAQVAIRWSLQKGFVPLPKSVTPHRIQENFDVFDFELTGEEVQFIDGLNNIGKVALNPDEVDF